MTLADKAHKYAKQHPQKGSEGMYQINLGPWEQDKDGNWFRRVGNSIEYAPTVVTTAGTFLKGSVRVEKAPVQKPAKQSRGFCPFTKTGIECSDQCARFGPAGCGLVTGEPPKAGKRCPLPGRFTCGKSCALWGDCNKKGD